jgi:proline iminopeptidase
MQVLPDGRYLPERDGHRVWWCEAGLPGGVPVLVLHGGPGGRTRLAPFSWFDGLAVRCIAFDQRGCGQSTPAGGLEHNTLADLVDDIERLRVELAVPAWGVAGGSWGALLAVAYAAAYPQRVKGLFLRSAFLGSDAEVARFFEPWGAWLGDAGAAWLGVAGSREPLALLQGFNAGTGDGPASPARVALAWQAFESAQSAPGGVNARAGTTFRPPNALPSTRPPLQPDVLPAGLAIQAHYLRQHCFLQPETVDRWLVTLRRAGAGRPMSLVHGLADAVCHPDVTAALASRWPHAALRWVEGAGHDMDAPAMRQALTEAAHEWVGALTRLA